MELEIDSNLDADDHDDVMVVQFEKPTDETELSQPPSMQMQEAVKSTIDQSSLRTQ